MQAVSGSFWRIPATFNGAGHVVRFIVANITYCPDISLINLHWAVLLSLSL